MGQVSLESTIPARNRRTDLASGTALTLYVALASFVIHLLFAGNYGYFRDELYYIVSGQHLQLGYVDFPPLIAYIAAFMNFVAGDSLVGIHLVPALASSILIFVAGKIAKELGGSKWAQLLAAGATAVSAVMAWGSIFSMDVLDGLWWSLAAFLIVRLIKRDQTKLWILVGVVFGVGLLTKLTIAFFIFAVLISLAATKYRRYFKSPWFWGAGLLVLAFLTPYAIWNAMNGWPTVDFYIHHGGLNGSGPVGFLALQLLIMNPVNLPLVIAGLVFYLRRPAGSQFKLLGVAYIVLLIVFALTNAKPYFIGPMYPLLFAGGSLLFTAATSRRWVWWLTRRVFPVVLV
ncbi:MAG: glycosyltransferase family 39 protein, partial [Thaumarchaeota archaeon]|nr:glycosyltransferase family 39 protein [Nitrososphaerota archaeon]